MKGAKMLRKFPAALLAAVMALSVVAGCGPSVDKDEIEQASNPVRQMHLEITQKLQADKNKADWYTYEDALIKARKDGKFAMVVFYTSWCPWCKKFMNETMTENAVAEDLILNFVSAKVDAESSDKVVHEMRQIPSYELADEMGVESYPTIVFFSPDGRQAKQLKGFLDAKDFLDYLAYIKSGAYKEREF